MQKVAYEKVKDIQQKHWWFAARKEIILDVFSRYCRKNEKGNKILDAGCGMGVMLEALSKYGDVYGMDMSEISVNYCSEKWGQNKILKGMLPNDLPFENNSFDNILALDLLKPIEDDMDAMKALYGMLKQKENLLVIVPAFKICKDDMRKNGEFVFSMNCVINFFIRKEAFKKKRISIMKYNCYLRKDKMFIWVPLR